MRTWIGISLGIHVAVFGVCGTRPAPTRNLALPATVYSVSLVSMPAPRAAPEPRGSDIEPPVEKIRAKPAPKAKVVDEEAIQPPSPTPKAMMGSTVSTSEPWTRLWRRVPATS